MSDASLAKKQPESAPQPPPQQFSQFPISSEVLEAIADMGFTTPTDVQSHVVLSVLQGRDCVVQAKTGSGKTCAFGIPLVERLNGGEAAPLRPQALVLAPTRELAQQVATALAALGSKKNVTVTAVYGGVPMGRQVVALKEGTDIVVGTPGRLLDHIRRKNLSLDALRAVILDEADEMLSLGFWDDVTELLRSSPQQRQTMLFSATLPYQVAQAAAMFLRDPVKVDVSGDELTVEGIENRIVHVVADIPKPRQLLYLLETEQPSSAIIFCNTRGETDMIAKYLTMAGFVAEPLSGNFRQKERERVMARIKSGELKYMVATDIAARGIDVEDLSHVVNYSLPEFSEVYLHRVGRTGRAGRTGVAVSLVDGRGLGTLSVLEREFNIGFAEITLPEEGEILRRRSARIMQELSERASVAEVGQHLPVATGILAREDARQVVAFLLKSYFAAEADDSRRGKDGEAASRPAGAGAGAGAGAPAAAEAAAGETPQGSGDESAGTRRRPRRRRRRRRNGAAASPAGEGMETMSASDALAPAAVADVVGDKVARIRVNIGFDDGFKGRGAVAKKIAALAGLNEGIVAEVESRRDHAVLRATSEIAEMIVERVNGAQIGKKVVSVALSNQ